jgi:hypothetical protein
MTIAKELGGTVADAFSWEDYETLLKETVGDNWDTLEEVGYIEKTDYSLPAWENAFGTPSRKFEFYITALDQAGMKIGKDLDYLPHYEPVRAEGDPATYPLTLIPAELMRLANGAIGSPPFCTKSLEATELKGNDLFVEINPKTAADHAAYDDYLAGKGVNANSLMGVVEDPISGLCATWGIRAKLTRV